MSFEDERKAIEMRLVNNFSLLPLRRIKFTNQPFRPPANQSWMAVDVLPGQGNQISLGQTGLQRYVGVIQFSIFLPEDSGTDEAREIADAIEPIFRQVQFSSGNSGTITTRTPWYAQVGVDQGWFHAVVSVTYQRDRRF